jgi:hypothetical protein
VGSGEGDAGKLPTVTDGSDQTDERAERTGRALRREPTEVPREKVAQRETGSRQATSTAQSWMGWLSDKEQ